MPTITRFVILMVVMLAACSPSVYFDKSPSVNFVRFHSFAFLPSPDNTTVSIYNNQIMDELIERSIRAEFISRGMEVNVKEPDLLLRVHLVVEEKEEMVNNSANRPYPYMGPYQSPYFYFPGPVYNDFRTIPYEKGTLIIDVIQRESGKLVWRGWSSETISSLPQYESKLPDLIAKIMSNYPIQKRGQ